MPATMTLTKQLQVPPQNEVRVKKQEKEEAVEEAISQEERDAAEAKLHILKSKKMTDKGPILLLVGPPGVGKTSLAKSVAMARYLAPPRIHPPPPISGFGRKPHVSECGEPY